MKNVLINIIISICILLFCAIIVFTIYKEDMNNKIEIEKLKLEIQELNQHNDSLEQNMLIILRKCN